MKTYLDEVVVDVERGKALPEIGGMLYVKSQMTDLTYELTVKSICSVEWTADGVRVRVRGSKRVPVGLN